MLEPEEKWQLVEQFPENLPLIRKIMGSKEFINGLDRFCLWIEDHQAVIAHAIGPIHERLERIREYRESGSDRGKLSVGTPHRFERRITAKDSAIIVPRVSSERRKYLPVGYVTGDVIISDAAQAIYDPPMFILSILASQLHIAWVSITAGRMKSDFRYSTEVCYNSFPVPKLTEQNKTDLTRCAEDILLAREAHFPATIAELYDPEEMPDDLRVAHDRNDETLERIHIGRRFRNDTERLEKLFDMYTKITAKKEKAS